MRIVSIYLIDVNRVYKPTYNWGTHLARVLVSAAFVQLEYLNFVTLNIWDWLFWCGRFLRNRQLVILTRPVGIIHTYSQAGNELFLGWLPLLRNHFCWGFHLLIYSNYLQFDGWYRWVPKRTHLQLERPTLHQPLMVRLLWGHYNLKLPSYKLVYKPQ